MASAAGIPAAAWPLGLGRRERRAAVARALLLGTGGAAVAYGAYRLYRSDAATEWRSQVSRLRAALAKYAEAFGTGAETLALLAADLRSFLASEQTELPPSLRQLARLMQSPEVAGTTSATVAALIRGVQASGEPSSASPAAAEAADGSSGSSPAMALGSTVGGQRKPALDRVIEALLSERGHSLVSVAVSLGARNLVTAYCDAQHRLAAADAAGAAAARAAAVAAGAAELPPLSPQPDLTNQVLEFLASPRGQQLAVLAVTAFVTGGMRAYLDQTLDINCYEDLLSAMAKPEHLEAVKACVGVFARDVVSSYLAGPSAAAQQAQQERQGAAAAAAGAAAQAQAQARLSLPTSIHELLGSAASGSAHDPADTGSPCASSASGEWQRQQQRLEEHAEAAAAAAAAAARAATPPGSDVDSDVLLQPQAVPPAVKGPPSDSGYSGASTWAVRTPPAAGEAGAPALPALRRVREQSQAAAGGAAGGLQREGSGNLEWISVVGKEWLNVAQHPHGRSVMVELAGTAAKEAAAGLSSALADRLRLEWMLVAAFAMLMLAWLAQRLMSVLLG